MDCRKAQYLISECSFEQGSCLPVELQLHVEKCESCRIELQKTCILHEQMGKLGYYEPPSTIRNNIQAAMKPEKRTCSEISDLLNAYIDEELSFWESDIVANHILECSDCADEVSFLRNLSRQLQLSEEFAPPIGLRVRILNKTTGFKTTNRWSWAVLRDLFSQKRVLQLGSGMVAIIFIFTMWININKHQTILIPESGNLVANNGSQHIHIQKPVKSAAIDNKNVRNDNFEFTVDMHKLNMLEYSNMKSNISAVPSSFRSTVKRGTSEAAKALKQLAKTNRLVRGSAKSKDFTIIPNSEDMRYDLKPNEPVEKQSEPEIVAYALPNNVNKNYENENSKNNVYFTKAVDQVQSKNKIDEWLANSRNKHNIENYEQRSANIRLIGIRF